MKLFGKPSGSGSPRPLPSNAVTDDRKTLQLIALNAIMANRFVKISEKSVLQQIATEAAQLVGGNPAGAESMQNAMADLTYIPRIEQMHIIAAVCTVLGIGPDIPGCEWIPVRYQPGVTDDLLITSLGVLRDLRTTNIVWSKNRIDFQAMYWRGLNIDYDATFEFLTADGPR